MYINREILLDILNKYELQNSVRNLIFIDILRNSEKEVPFPYIDEEDKKRKKEGKEEEAQMHDSVNHPKHYTSHPSGVECIEITRHYCFSIGNAIKYLWRAGLKKDVGLEDKQKEIEDLKKAIWYINDRIKQLKNK
jgi:hypothetical protein